MRVYAYSTLDFGLMRPIRRIRADLWEALDVKRYTVTALPATKEIHITLVADKPWAH